MKRLVLLVGVLVLAACGGTDSGPDAGAQLACTHFSNVAQDAADGVLTNEELRSKIKEVEDDASVSDEPGVADAARRMLAAVTAVDPEAYGDAVTDFVAACNAAAD